MNKHNLSEWITDLSNIKPIAQGRVRQVWNRPGHPTQLLKTIHPQKIQKYANKNVVLQAIDDLRFGPYGTFWIEYRYYMKTSYKCLKADRRNPIAEIGGLIATDRGLAQVCEKITDLSGELAKPISVLIKNQTFDEAKVLLLNEFIDTLFSLNVNVPDLSSENIVFDEVRNRFVLIDGYGDKTLIPIREWCRPLNQKRLFSRFSEMTGAGYLKWDPHLRKFSLV